MNKLILNTTSQEFIAQHLNTEITSLALKSSEIKGIDIKDLIEQIESKKKSQKKLPTWFNTQNIYYPNKLNIEQTSSEITAEYKASLIKGKAIIDLTGGFGVDCYYFSKQFASVIHCEIDTELSEMVSHNYECLGAKSINTNSIDGMTFLKTLNKTVDWIYIDPSRRHESKGKVFFLKDCLPNVPENLELLFNHSDHIMIKTSPLLDLSVGVDDLRAVKTIHVVAVNNEVKELLWILEKGYKAEITVETVNIKSDTKERFKFKLNEESQSEAKLSAPLSYLYEPNSSVLKAGAFNSVALQLNLFKLHKHSHLYTSEKLIEFPGRRFEIQKSIPYQKKEIKRHGITKANITTRNFTETVDQLRKKFNIKDGGTSYLFFTTNLNNAKILLECSKIS